MSYNALRSQLLPQFEFNLLVLGHLSICYADACYVVQQAW
jgi:hypothetical protein